MFSLSRPFPLMSVINCSVSLAAAMLDCEMWQSPHFATALSGWLSDYLLPVMLLAEVTSLWQLAHK